MQAAADHCFSIRVTPADADLALRRFLLRDAGWMSALAVLFCWGYFAVRTMQDRLTLWPIVGGACGLLLPLLYLVAYGIRSRHNKELFKNLGDAPVSYRFTADRLHLQTPSSDSSVDWSLIKQLWVDPDLTLIFYARNA